MLLKIIRRELIKKLNYNFEIIPSKYEEELDMQETAEYEEEYEEEEGEEEEQA